MWLHVQTFPDSRTHGKAQLNIELVSHRDATTLAALHAASWKVTYRGILSDEYLDVHADSERLQRWQERFVEPHGNSFGLQAREAGDVVGFAWVDLDDDLVYGHLLDNLHVHPARKQNGIGRKLLAGVASEIIARSEHRSLFLWVYEENHGARAFYDRMLGAPVERKQVTTLDNRRAWQWRYAWNDVQVLLGSNTP